jgi:hypothetical protein
MLTNIFFKNENQSIMLTTDFFKKIDFIEFLAYLFLDILKMSNFQNNLLIMIPFPRLLRVFDFTT